jgi:hypothetical protein|tara:strand:- start:99 stop:491 length:393 start_codon:yes stop_codon:yes gene_type:complete
MSASTKNLLNIAEGILAKTPPVKEVVTKSNAIVDDGLKAVVVPDAYVNKLLGFAEALNESADPNRKEQLLAEAESIDEAQLLKERVESLVERLRDLIIEAKEVVSELTSTGMIPPAPLKKKKKHELIRRN